VIPLGVNVPNFGPEAEPAALLDWARFAEDSGFSTLVVSDHVATTPEVRALAATLHLLGGNRFVFGVGSGWAATEFAALGLDATAQGRMTDRRRPRRGDPRVAGADGVRRGLSATCWRSATR